MKIILTNDFYEDYGGAGQVFDNSLNLLKKHSHEVSSFVLAENSLGEEIKKTGSYFIKPKNRLNLFFLKYFNYPLYIKFRNFIRKTHPDIIHCHQNYCSPLSLLLAARLENIPVVQTIHDFGLSCMSIGINRKTGEICNKGKLFQCFKNKCVPLNMFIINALAWKLRQWTIRNMTDAIICPSKTLVINMNNLGYKNIYQLYNFVEFSDNKKNNKKYDLIFVGRLTERKGLISLIYALKKIIIDFPQCKLLIIGDGPERSKINKLVLQLNLQNNVIFKGTVKSLEISNYYQQSKIFIIPSIGSENNPLAIIEAMASGLPIVASNIGGIPEMVEDGKNGFLYQPLNINKLAKDINTLLKNEKLRDQFSNNNINKYKKNYTSEHHYNKLIKIYKEILKQSRLSVFF